MSHLKRTSALPLPPGHFRVLPKRFVFFDKSNGSERFEVNASPNGTLPVKQAAGLMAIHCLSRGRSPKDFGIMIAPEEDLLDDLLPMADRLVNASVESPAPVSLSQRQKEVLQALLHDGSNKGIAARLNISVRTVKFHISALLQKFNVNSRVGLVRKAADVFGSEGGAPASASHARTAPILRANGKPVAWRERLLLPPLRMVSGQSASR
jgi:DNA-binding CsgD family transcriptional regulator